MDSVAKSIDHIEDRIRMSDLLPDRRQHSNGVEHSSEIRQWCEEKVWDDRCRVETICDESIQESDK